MLLPDICEKLVLYVVQVPQAASGFNWWGVVPTLVGGLLATLTALATFRLNNSAIRKREEEKERKGSAASALSGHFKLLQWLNLIGNINSGIDRDFLSRSEEGFGITEPFSIIRATHGRLLEPDPLNSGEYGFLLNKEDYDIVDDIIIFEQRGYNVHYLFNKYSDMRIEMDNWLESIPGFVRNLDGPIVQNEIPIKFSVQYELRAGQLNMLIVGIIEHIEDDMIFGAKAHHRFLDAAYEHFSPHFPKVKLGGDLPWLR